MLIGELAHAADVSRDTIRFYEKRGLIQSLRQNNGYKYYSASALNTLEFVKLAKELGFSLSEISSILPMLTGEGLAPEMAQSFVQEKMIVIDQRIANLKSLRERLANLPIGDQCPLRRDCTVIGQQSAPQILT